VSMSRILMILSLTSLNFTILLMVGYDLFSGKETKLF